MNPDPKAPHMLGHRKLNGLTPQITIGRLLLAFVFAVCARPGLAVDDQPAPSPMPTSTAAPLDRVVAVVNDDVVMATELEDQVSAVYQRLATSNTQAPPREELVPQVLDKLILDRLQLNMGLRAGIKISDEEVNQAIARIAQQQGYSAEQFVAAAQRQGLTSDKLRARVTEEIIISRVQQGQVQRRINITEQEIDNFLKSEEGKTMSSPDVNLGHILLTLSPSAPATEVEEVLRKAETIRQQAEQGTDFRQLAVANSSGPNALQGGDLGWRKMAQLPPLFTTELAKMSPGQVTPPMRSDAGYHLLKLYDRRDSGGEKMIEQSNVRHILVKPNEIRNEEDSRRFIESLRTRILNGEDFAKIARQYSEDPGSALKGGELGWSVPGQFVPEFEQAVNNAELNVITAPLRTQFGWHIIQVTERRQQDFSQEIMRSQAANSIRQRKFEEELQIWLQQIRDEAFVEIKL